MGHNPADADLTNLPTPRTVRERRERCLVVQAGYARVVRRLSVTPLNLRRTTRWNLRVGPPYVEIAIPDESRFEDAAVAALTGRGPLTAYLAAWPLVDEPVGQVSQLDGITGGVEFLVRRADC